LLMGLTPEELVTLHREQVNLERGLITVQSENDRTYRLEEPLLGFAAAHLRSAPKAATSLLHDHQGVPRSVGDIAKMVVYSAYDAALEAPQEITPETLRHTYLLFLLRQGIRLTDIADIAGPIPHEDLVTYMRMVGSCVRRPLDQIERVLPPLRGLNSGPLDRQSEL